MCKLVIHLRAEKRPFLESGLDIPICRQIVDQKNLGTVVEFVDKSGIFVDKNKTYEHF